MMTAMQPCRGCGYWAKESSNRSRHRKGCKALEIFELREENERLRAQYQEAQAGAEHSNAALQALAERMEAKYTQLAEKVEKLEAQQQALVLSAKPTTVSTVNNTVNNNNITINIYTYKETPLPKKNEVLALLKTPSQALPSYFQRKHLSDPKTRNLKLVGNDKMSVYSKDRAGVSKWTTRERRPMLTQIVERLIDDLLTEYESPRDEGWKQWKAYCSAEGLNPVHWSHPEAMEAFQAAERQIEIQLAKSSEA